MGQHSAHSFGQLSHAEDVLYVEYVLALQIVSILIADRMKRATHEKYYGIFASQLVIVLLWLSILSHDLHIYY